MYGIREYLQACQYRQSFLREQLHWLHEERNQFGEDAKRLEGASDRIRQEIVGYLVPEVHDQSIVAIEAKLKYPGLTPIKREYDARFQTAERRRVELESMDEIQHYEYQIAQAQQDMEDVRPAYDKKRAELDPWETSKWFLKLQSQGYFETDYSPGFLRRFFDWRAISFLMAELSKKAGLDFAVPADLVKHYRALRADADTVFDAFNKRAAKRDRIERIKSEYEEILKAPEQLLAELFRALGDATLQHLDACPEDLKLELAKGDQHLNAFLRKETGIRKQIQYLRELAVTRVDARIQQLEQELDKTESKIRKLNMQQRRGKRKRYSQNDISRMRNVKAEKWKRRQVKTAKVRRKVSDFDSYDEGSFASDYLWWDLMTGGAAADDIFEVRDFRHRNPGWDHRRYQDPIVGAGDDDSSDVLGVAAEDLASSMMTPDEDTFSDLS